VQKLLYIGIILVVIAQVMSGLAIWKPVQFSHLMLLFRNFEMARVMHFLGMSAICLFLAVHVTLALVAPRTLLAMITGGPPVNESPQTPAVATPHAGRENKDEDSDAVSLSVPSDKRD
jgi:cytochrome b subunit of formate dehydrogenase